MLRQKVDPKKESSFLYENTEKGELQEILMKAEWVLRKNVEKDPEKEWLSWAYSGRQSFGITDYKDHSKDTLKQLKEKILKKIKNIAKRQNKSVCLVCWEKNEAECHRRLVAEWVEKELNIEIPEYGKTRKNTKKYRENAQTTLF